MMKMTADQACEPGALECRGRWHKPHQQYHTWSVTIDFVSPGKGCIVQEAAKVRSK